MPYHFEGALFIPRPRAEVFAFFADAANLERITPTFLHFHILTPRPIAMHAGILIDYELRLFGIPFHWRTNIETSANLLLPDIQLTGPYRSWHHRHEFTDTRNGTLMRDHVEYEPPSAPWAHRKHHLRPPHRPSNLRPPQLNHHPDLPPINL